METYCFKNISYTYGGSTEAVLKNVSFDVLRGEFVVVCGASGSGKTTLLRCIKEAHQEFGYVSQNPSNQIVTDKVRHELAFGMENMGIQTEKMRHAIAGTATYFGMEDWMERDTYSLSGGEKQLLNLASVLVTDPEVILLDEPTAQLDPMAASAFLDILRRLNSQLGITVILVEQRLEEVLALCDKMMVLHEGQIVDWGRLDQVYEKICHSELSEEFLDYMPSFVRFYHRFSEERNACPSSVKECRNWFYGNDIQCSVVDSERSLEETGRIPSIECRNLFFRYEKRGKDVLREVCFEAVPGRIYGIAGGNGTGKSTFLKVLAGAEKCYHGKMKIQGRISYLPQEPKYMFIGDRICDIIKTEAAMEKFGLHSILARHPYDVSGGQMQRTAMAYLYEQDGDIFLFDEPTKGLDPFWKKQFGLWLVELAEAGKTVIVVSHDVEFAANTCEYMSMSFDGEISPPMKTQDFFRGGLFYTTAIQRIVGDRYPQIVAERFIYEE